MSTAGREDLTSFTAVFLTNERGENVHLLNVLISNHTNSSHIIFPPASHIVHNQSLLACKFTVRAYYCVSSPKCPSVFTVKLSPIGKDVIHIIMRNLTNIYYYTCLINVKWYFLQWEFKSVCHLQSNYFLCFKRCSRWLQEQRNHKI